MQDRNLTEKVAGVENPGLKNDGLQDVNLFNCVRLLTEYIQGSVM